MNFGSCDNIELYIYLPIKILMFDNLNCF